MNDTKVAIYKDGIVILGSWPGVKPVIERWQKIEEQQCPLIITDPPYGNIVKNHWDKYSTAKGLATEQIQQAKALESLAYDGAALYWFGGYGKVGFRPFFIFLACLELHSAWNLSMPIVWGKKRAYGTEHNYLATREEIAFCIKGDIKKPRLFNKPLLDIKRGYAGYSKKYPAKSEYKRRTAVWTDVTELLRGKIHVAQKPLDLLKIPIEVHTKPGEHVIDPFAGSGSTGVAARELGRKFVLVEQDKESFDIILSRLGDPVMYGDANEQLR